MSKFFCFSRGFRFSSISHKKKTLYTNTYEHINTHMNLLLTPTPEAIKAEDVVNSTMKYISAVMFDRRDNISSMTYSFNLKKTCMYMYLKNTFLQIKKHV